MRILELDADTGRAVTAWDSTGVRNLPVLRTTVGGATDVLRFAPGSRLGRHAAGWTQLFWVVEGSGWVSGADGVRRRLRAGQAASWDQGEQHEAGSDEGMTVLVVQSPGHAGLPPVAERSPAANAPG
jgi:quercetin dioxygenase-like cupin family protein